MDTGCLHETGGVLQDIFLTGGSWVCLFYDPFMLAVASVVKKAGMGHKKADNPSLIYQQIKACRKIRSSFRYFVPMSSTHDGIELMPTQIFGNVVHVRPSN